MKSTDSSFLKVEFNTYYSLKITVHLLILSGEKIHMDIYFGDNVHNKLKLAENNTL